MKKSRERASMTRALVYYTRLGEDSWSESPLEVYKRIDGSCRGNVALAIDIWAVKECILFLRVTGDRETLSAIEEIYVKPFEKKPMRPISKNEISMRVLRFAYENNLDERTVYRRLRKARQLWEDIRSTAKK